jgi:hypothetical protein
MEHNLGVIQMMQHSAGICKKSCLSGAQSNIHREKKHFSRNSRDKGGLNYVSGKFQPPMACCTMN